MSDVTTEYGVTLPKGAPIQRRIGLLAALPKARVIKVVFLFVCFERRGSSFDARLETIGVFMMMSMLEVIACVSLGISILAVLNE